MAQKIEKVFCPSCGAPVQFLDGREDTFCTHCGHQIFREDTNLELKLKHEEEMGRQQVELDDNRVIDRNNTISMIAITIFAIAAFVWAAYGFAH